MHVKRTGSMRLKTLAILSAILIVSTGWEWVHASSTASTTANMTANIIASISIAKTRDLAFGQAAPGDSAKTVASSDATNSAGFDIGGQANTAYNITLPSSSINMTTGSGSTADEQISVGTFTSNPSGSGTLSGAGTQSLAAGATRAAIRATQTPGSYTGVFTVTVTYQ